MTNKNILFLINKFSVGGAERMFAREINEIESSFVGTLYKEGENSLSNLLNKEINCFDFKKMNDKDGVEKVINFCSKNNIDVIYSTLEEANVVSRTIKKKTKNIRVVTREANVAKNKSLKFKLFDIFLNKYTDAIVAVSKGVKDSLISYQPFYKDKFVVIENAIEIKNDIPSRVCESGKARLLMVGSLTEQKNYIATIKALKPVFEKHNITLNIAGEGYLRQEIEGYIKSVGLENKVKLLGLLDKENLNKAYKGSDIFILGSLWEGFPNVILEAMSFGLPVISMRVSGAEDVIEDGSSGFLVRSDELNSKVSELVENCELRENLSQNTLKRIQDYGIDQHISRLMKVL